MKSKKVYREMIYKTLIARDKDNHIYLNYTADEALDKLLNKIKSDVVRECMKIVKYNLFRTEVINTMKKMKFPEENKQ